MSGSKTTRTEECGSQKKCWFQKTRERVCDGGELRFRISDFKRGGARGSRELRCHEDDVSTDLSSTYQNPTPTSVNFELVY